MRPWWFAERFDIKMLCNSLVLAPNLPICALWQARTFSSQFWQEWFLIHLAPLPCSHIGKKLMLLLLVIMCEDDVHRELHIFLHHLLVVHSTREGGCSLIVCPFYDGRILIWKRSFVCRVYVMWKCVWLYPQAKGCFKTANATSSGNWYFKGHGLPSPEQHHSPGPEGCQPSNGWKWGRVTIFSKHQERPTCHGCNTSAICWWPKTKGKNWVPRCR